MTPRPKCRYGGEEFLILLPDTTSSGACRVAEVLRGTLEEHPVRWNEIDVPITASFGLTAVTPGELDVTASNRAGRRRALSRQGERPQLRLPC